MEQERINLGQRERDRLRVLHEVEQGHLQQIEAARRLRLSDRQIRRMQARLRQQRDGGLMHGLRGRRSNRKIPEVLQQRAMRQLGRSCYAGFGPTLASEHLARQGMLVSRETLRKWMSQAGLWQSRPARRKALHVWRPRRAAFGELVLMDSSPFCWLEDRGPAGHLIALIDDASSRVWGRLVEHDSTEENLRTLQGWLLRWGRPQASYTDKNSTSLTSRPVQPTNPDPNLYQRGFSNPHLSGPPPNLDKLFPADPFSVPLPAGRNSALHHPAGPTPSTSRVGGPHMMRSALAEGWGTWRGSTGRSACATKQRKVGTRRVYRTR
jgi:hypothetical protein